jgi:hypothetical protein
MVDEDYDSLQAEIDVDFRPLWKKVKATHAQAIAAKKIKFGEDLGPQLDKLSALNAQLLNTGKKRLKRTQLTTDEINETDKAKRKAVRAKLLANDKANQAQYKGDLKAMRATSSEVLRVAELYKTKIKGLGDPAEQEINQVLDKIIQGANKEKSDAQALEIKFKDRIAQPNRLDYLK